MIHRHYNMMIEEMKTVAVAAVAPVAMFHHIAVVAKDSIALPQSPIQIQALLASFRQEEPLALHLHRYHHHCHFSNCLHAIARY